MLHVIMRSRLNVQNLLTALSSDHPGVNLIGISVPSYRMWSAIVSLSTLRTARAPLRGGTPTPPAARVIRVSPRGAPWRVAGIRGHVLGRALGPRRRLACARAMDDLPWVPADWDGQAGAGEGGGGSLGGNGEPADQSARALAGGAGAEAVRALAQRIKMYHF